MYRDRKTNIGKITAPSSSPAMFATVTMRLRKNVRGRSGAPDRDSISRNPAISTAAVASRPIVVADVQPWLVAVTTAYTSTDNPPVTVIAPATSKRRWPSPARLSGSSGRAAATIPAPTGTLTEKNHRQDSPGGHTP